MAGPVQQFVLMPFRGLRASLGPNLAESRSFLGAHVSGRFSAASRSLQPLSASAGTHPVTVLDSIHEDGAKLVEATPQAMMILRATQPGLRVVPVVYYKPAIAPRPIVEARPKSATGALATKMTITIVAKQTGKPIPKCMVVAFLDFDQKLGDMGTTNSKGQVSLRLGSNSKKVERLYVYPEVNFWGLLKKNDTIANGDQFPLLPLAPNYPDAVRHFYGASDLAHGAGITVGVVDSGIDTQHPDLRVAGGLNTVQGEQPNDFGDNGGHHGTHVGGIVAARGQAPSGRLGIAPNVMLRSYRVFGKNADGASNFAIAKAIDSAITDGCDLINMSLGGGPADPLTQTAIADARSAGTLVIVAAGNEDRSPVDFPARDSRSIAVSALGRKGTFPTSSTEAGEVAKPFGKDKKNFIAAFSNIGPEIDFTGPGVGIVSTVPGGYAPMSGTSMACPAVTGFAARLLAGQLSATRDQSRSDAMAQALFAAAKNLGFPLDFQGHGLPQ